ncbi:MAG: hypothetical protein H3C28_10835 [Sphingomonadales bacterium]|nr:hypothetical protein [Sphingomonadales bacterium]
MLQQIFLPPREFIKSHGVVMAHFLLVFYRVLDDFPGDFSARRLAEGDGTSFAYNFMKA